MKVLLKLFAVTILLGLGLLSCTDNSNTIIDSRQNSIKSSNSGDMIPLVRIVFNARKAGSGLSAYCQPSTGHICTQILFWTFLSGPNPNDFSWPRPIVENQGPGVYALFSCRTSNTLNLNVTYFFANEETGLQNCEHIVNRGYWTLPDDLLFDNDEIVNVIETDNSIRIPAGNYPITIINEHQFSVDLPYEEVRQ